MVSLSTAYASDAQTDQSNLKKGLNLLYQGVPAAGDPEELLNQAMGFQKKFKDLVESAPGPKVIWKRVNQSTLQFEFPSLVQRPNHPSYR